MHHEIKGLALLGALSLNLALTACGGGSSGANGNAANSVEINGVTYSASGNSVYADGYVDQTSEYGYQLGGPAAVISMYDTQTGNSLYFQVLSTVDGWPGIFAVLGTGTSTTAYVTDKSVATGGNMEANSLVSGTGGTITFNSFGSVGQAITGSYNINLCDRNAACSASVKNYTGSFNITRAANIGSLAEPSSFQIPQSTSIPFRFGIHPTTGKNHFIIPANATGGTMTITLTPTVDVNMSVYADAGFTTPATCDVTSTLNVTGNGAETCAISVTANQEIYVTVSQPASATDRETFTLAMSE